MSILEQINTPEELKKIPEDSLIQLCQEVRQKIIDDCAENPGHLGSSLGVVELTVALHYTLDTPYDNLIWDVGHQSYAHKILTGRKELFKTKRIYGGISGFPKISESEYDSFGTGHSSTSISAALGMAIAAKMSGEESRQSIAVVGDGAMTGGMAFEALNNAGVYNSNLLVILNDNNMAIDPNVGGLNEYLLDITTSKGYNKIKQDIWNVLGKLNRISPGMRNFIQNIDNSIKSMLLKQSNLFEAMGLRYFGPVDGHDVNHLVKVLRDLKNIKGPKVLHCITIKGKGFKEAETNQTLWHAPGKFDPATGRRSAGAEGSPLKYQDVFGNTLLELARADGSIVAITAAMSSGTSVATMQAQIPERVFDVGISEGHAVTFAGGLAKEGMKPFVAIYSSFLQRAYVHIFHDVALMGLPVTFCIDRAGLVGEDGATHHGAYDMAYLRTIPGMTIAAPRNEHALRNLMYTAATTAHGPMAIRYPRGTGRNPQWRNEMTTVEIGRGTCLREGADVAVLTIGPVADDALQAAEEAAAKGVEAAVYDMQFIKPIDTSILEKVAASGRPVITVEDGCATGGLAGAVAEWFAANAPAVTVTPMGIPDRFIPQASPAQQHAMCGFDHESIAKAIMESANKSRQ